MPQHDEDDITLVLARIRQRESCHRPEPAFRGRCPGQDGPRGLRG
jgi:hypothetical protein